VETCGANALDVNEQKQAMHVYQKLGFAIMGRLEQDGQANPFPLLHRHR